ncbi:unnamed protein product [Bemisia tabaci]|uniref:Condensin complex subunit 1 C-terminal domain-containing protein n=1 Tax=Bemisia tabaci TaxID=7038 RepID=A0A9P0F4C6_BEMTA|nr:unnamed protein product [Bemisia tabaci]
MDVISALDKLGLEKLPTGWVSNVWNNSFSEIDVLPPEYEAYLEEIIVVDVLDEISVCFKIWLESDDSASTARLSLNTSSIADDIDVKSWQYLIKKEIRHKALICLLSYFIHQAKSESNDEDARHTALSAISVYVMLLAVPGSQVFHIFNSILFSSVLEVLEKFCDLVKTRSSNIQHRTNDDSLDGDETNNESLSHQERSHLEKWLNALLKRFTYAFRKINFRSQEESLASLIQWLAKVTRLEKSTVITQYETNATGFNALPMNAFNVLKALCSPDVGEVPEVVCAVLKELMPAFLVEKKQAAREHLTIKENVINFMKHLMETLGDASYPGVRVLIQHLCLLIPDKADLRIKAVSTILEILSFVPADIYGQTVIWIYSFCHSDNVKHRINALEIMSRLILEALVRFTNEDSPLIKYTTYPFLIAIVLSRCKDNAASVRTKALTVFSNALSSNNPNIRAVIEGIFVTPYQTEDENVTKAELKRSFPDFNEFFKCIEEETEWNENPLPGARIVLKFLDVFVADNKVFVKKSALMCLASICCLHPRWMNDELLQVLTENCRDRSVLIRKSLTQCMTTLLERYPENELVCKYWVQGVLPLLFDTEQKAQEKVLEVFAQLLIDNMAPHNQSITPPTQLPWRILSLISEFNLRKYLRFACAHWVASNVFNQALINTLQTHIGTENNANAWLFVVCMTEYHQINNPNFIMTYYATYIHANREADIYVGQMVLDSLKFTCKKLSKEVQNNLVSELLPALKNFSIPHQLILQSFDILALLADIRSISNGEGNLAVSITQECERYIEEKLDKNTPVEEVDEELLCRRILTLGCVAVLWPTGRPISEKAITSITNLVDVTFGVNVRMRFMTGLLPAMAVVTLGRLALQTDLIAKEFVPLFGRLLRRVREPQIKINTITALADLCIRYTAMVEKFIPEICVCLCDPEVKVRSTTLMLLIDLIQQDYLKLRCPVFFHLLSRLNDDNEKIREVISDCFVNNFLRNNPSLIIQHFVESLFYYNAYYDHPAYCKMQMSSREREVFSLEGPANQGKRYFIYKYMLEHVADEHRLKIFMRLCADILDGVADGKIKLENEGIILLKDALHVLCSEEIKLRPVPMQEPENDDLGEERQEYEIAVTKAVLNQAVRSQAVEFIVPIIIRLKKVLQQKKLLLNELMLFTRELMKDYKNELKTLLAADKELAQEVELDLQLLEEQENAARAQERTEQEPQPEPELLNISRCSVRMERIEVRAEVHQANQSGPEDAESEPSAPTVNGRCNGRSSDAIEELPNDRPSTPGVNSSRCSNVIEKLADDRPPTPSVNTSRSSSRCSVVIEKLSDDRPSTPSVNTSRSSSRCSARIERLSESS